MLGVAADRAGVKSPETGLRIDAPLLGMLAQLSLVLARQSPTRAYRIKTVRLLELVKNWLGVLNVEDRLGLRKVDPVLPEVIEIVRRHVEHGLAAKRAGLVLQVGPDVFGI